MSSSVSRRPPRAPLTDAVIVALSRLVDDAQTGTREPSHSDIEFQVGRAKLAPADPKSHGQVVGKAKRVRAILSWAIENAPDAGEIFAAALVALVRGKGGFRSSSPNFVGADVATDLSEALRSEGFILTSEGELQPATLDALTGVELTRALESYVRRARRGSEDAALVVGTSKDLLEATAAHIIQSHFGFYPQQANFPTLLGQAFTSLGLATPMTPARPGEPAQSRLQRAMYEAGCAVNALRNKEGTGHGRPWLPSVTDVEARAAVQLIGIVAGFLLAAHEALP